MSIRTAPAEPAPARSEDLMTSLLLTKQSSDALQAAPQGQTIGTSLGIAPQQHTPKPYVPPKPEYRPTAHAEPDVVGSLFGDIDVDDTEGFLSDLKAKGKAGLAKAKASGKSALAKAKAATDQLTLENAKGALSKAKESAKGALQKAKSGVGAAMKKLAEATADITNFDYQIESGDSMVIGAIKKKGADVKTKHQLLPFPVGSWAGHPFWQITQDQQKRMWKAQSQTKVSKKGGEEVSKEVEKLVREPHALCMGFFEPSSRTKSEMQAPSASVEKTLKGLIYNPGTATADVPTLADTRALFLPAQDLGAADELKPEKLSKDKKKAHAEAVMRTQGEAKEAYEAKAHDWACASGVLVELAEADGLHTDAKGNVPYAFQAVPEEPAIDAFDGAFDPQNINDVFGITVRGIHVTRDKEIVLGPKIYLPAKRDDMNNLAMYACAEDGVGMVRAVNKASKADGIDMRMLWAAMQFGRGLADLYASKITSKTIKDQLGPMFGGLNLNLSENSVRGSYEDEVPINIGVLYGFSDDEEAGVISDVVF